ncbi:MAG: hypothetical protein WKF97_19690 [Chitinophagaceae bacterium]
MKSFYKTYVFEFQKCAQSSLDRVSLIKRLPRFANILNLKANQLLRQASSNNITGLPKLQKELFEMGRDYVQKFSLILRQKGTKQP